MRYMNRFPLLVILLDTHPALLGQGQGVQIVAKGS